MSRGVQGRRAPVFEDVDMSEERLNETISSKYDNVQEDTAKYYDPTPVSFSSAWVDLDRLNASGRATVTEHPMLSAAYRRAATIALNFSFPFYGHDVRNITIATGGFLYTGKYVHSWLAATQYIAPLMANFDTSQDDKAKIRYADNGQSGLHSLIL